MSLLPGMVAASSNNGVPEYSFAFAQTGAPTTAPQYISTGSDGDSGFVVNSLDSDNFVAMAQPLTVESAYLIQNSNNDNRWYMGVQNVESTLDAGSDLAFDSFHDDGSIVGLRMKVVRADGQLVTNGPGGLLVSQGDILASGNVTVGGFVGGASISSDTTIAASGSVSGASIVSSSTVESQFVEITSSGTSGLIQPKVIRNGLMVNGAYTYVQKTIIGNGFSVDADAGQVNSLMAIITDGASPTTSMIIAANSAEILALPLGSTVNIMMRPSPPNPATILSIICTGTEGGPGNNLGNLNNTLSTDYNTMFSYLKSGNTGSQNDWIYLFNN